MNKAGRLLIGSWALGLFMVCSGVFVPDASALTARSAIVMEAKSGRICFQRNINMRLPAASTVKVFTAVIASEKLKLKDRVEISKRAAGIAPSKAYLSEKKYYKVDDLLRCLLMSSANDAGVALAEHMGESEFQFSRMMNSRAKALGAKNSYFLNATGLPEPKKSQYSTAYDLALFMKESLKYPRLVEIMQTKHATVSGSDGKPIVLRNHNKFLWRESNDLIGKTGYTRKAMHCFLGTFTKNKRRYIVAIQGSQKPWADLAYLLGRKY